jgi:hypothetical protein
MLANLLPFIIFIYLILLDPDSKVIPHEKWLNNLQKMWDLATKRREKYRKSMADRYNSMHNIFEYVKIKFVYINTNIILH